MKHSMLFIHVIAGLAWYSVVTYFNLISSEPAQFILIYTIPVMVITWRYGLQLGFIMAAVGAFSAVASGAVTGHEHAEISLAEEGLFAFFQISVISIGVYLGKRSVMTKK